MPQPEPAGPLYETMLSMLHEARRRGMAHEEYSLPVCELLLEIHAPAGGLRGALCRLPGAMALQEGARRHRRPGRRPWTGAAAPEDR